MSKSSGQVQVLTANRLRDGAVVFLNFDGDWIASLTGVVIARSPDEARGLEARGQFDAGRNLVVDPYLVDMREVAGALLPLRQRERVRLEGPSILDDVPGYLAPAALAAAAGNGREGNGTEPDGRCEPLLPAGRPGPHQEAA
jgi:Protein of unknown function (DUF2849)